MSINQKNSNNSVEKLNEASSSLFPSNFSSPGTPPPPPPPPLPSPRVRDIPASLCFGPALPNHVLYQICPNLQPAPLRRPIVDALTGTVNHHSKKHPKPQLEPKPAAQTAQTAPRPSPPPPLTQPPTLIPKPSIPTLPRLTPKPTIDDQLPSVVKKAPSSGSSSTGSLKDKRMKKNDDKAEDDKSADNSGIKGMESQLALSGISKTITDQIGKNMELTPDRRLLRARHGGGGIKPQGDCSQPSMYGFRPTPISSAAPLNAIRPTCIPHTKSCTATAPSPQSTSAVPTGVPNFLSTNRQDSFKLVASGFAARGQQTDQCVPTGLPVNHKEKSSTVTSSYIASLLMPPPSTIPSGQRKPSKSGKTFLLRSTLLTLQDQVCE